MPPVGKEKEVQALEENVEDESPRIQEFAVKPVLAHDYSMK